MTMTIDMHTHVAPRQAVKIAESGGKWHGVEFYRDKNDKQLGRYLSCKNQFWNRSKAPAQGFQTAPIIILNDLYRL